MSEIIVSGKMPVLALRGLVVFPNSKMQFDIGREKSVNAVMEAMDGDRRIFLAAQRDITIDNPGGKGRNIRKGRGAFKKGYQGNL